MSSVVSGIFGGGGEDAAKSAGYAQAAGSAAGAETVRHMFDVTRQDLTPYRLAGEPALDQYRAILGLAGPRERTESEQARLDELLGLEASLRAQEADYASKLAQAGTSHATRHYGEAFGPKLARVRQQLSELSTLQGYSAIGSQTPEALEQRRQEALASIQETPGQAFIRERAQKQLLQNAAAIGGVGGGNVRTELVRQGAGFAQQDLQHQLGRLQYLIGGGQSAAAQTGQFGAHAAGQIAGFQQDAGQARASGILGAQQARASGISNLVSGIGTAVGLFSDERLKHDVVPLDTEACFNAVVGMPLKAWRYLEGAGLDTTMHFGPMAQDAPDMIKGGEVDGYHILNLHDELMMIAGAIQHMKNTGMLKCH